MDMAFPFLFNEYGADLVIFQRDRRVWNRYGSRDQGIVFPLGYAKEDGMRGMTLLYVATGAMFMHVCFAHIVILLVPVLAPVIRHSPDDSQTRSR